MLHLPNIKLHGVIFLRYEPLTLRLANALTNTNEKVTWEDIPPCNLREFSTQTLGISSNPVTTITFPTADETVHGDGSIDLNFLRGTQLTWTAKDGVQRIK
ncbi:hypothetical protein [Rothia endophytica]|uniref:Uncharacterized protein n=1 Tax=Rothia endophytica TaxID=1324766 RepID=A0ABP9BKV3_9MICC